MRFSWLCSFVFLAVFACQARLKAENRILAAAQDATSNLIILTLDEPLSLEPSVYEGEGVSRVTFPSSSFKPNLSPLAVNLSFIRQAVFDQVGADTVLEISFKDSISTRGKLAVTSTGKTVRLELFEHASFNPTQHAAAPASNNLESSSLVLGFKVIASLAFVCCLIFFIFALYQKLLISKGGVAKKDARPRIKAVYPLQGKQKLWLVDYDGVEFLLGVSPQSIELISQFDKEKNAAIDAWLEEDGADFALLRAKLLFTPIQPARAPKEQNLLALHQAKGFKEELQRRLKKLKPIQ